MNIWKKVTIAASVAGLIVAAWLAWGAGATVAEAAGAHCNGAPNCRDSPRRGRRVRQVHRQRVLRDGRDLLQVIACP